MSVNMFNMHNPLNRIALAAGTAALTAAHSASCIAAATLPFRPVMPILAGSSPPMVSHMAGMSSASIAQAAAALAQVTSTPNNWSALFIQHQQALNMQAQAQMAASFGLLAGSSPQSLGTSPAATGSVLTAVHGIASSVGNVGTGGASSVNGNVR